jgi:YegS/Rv2252/BmrU family lipid kinase
MNSTPPRPSDDKPLVIVFNRRALAARALRRSGLEEALRERGLKYYIVEAESTTEARESSRESAGSGHVVIAAGGDGTAHDVANGILESGEGGAIMGHIALGSGNDFARALGRISWGLERALDAIVEMNVRNIDVAQVNGREYFINVLGVGFDAEVARRRSTQKVRFPGYFPGIVRTMIDYRARRYRARLPEVEVDDRALLIAAMNGPSEGGGFRLAPEASLEDGLLDVYWIDPVSFWQFARYVWAVRWGTHGRLPMVRHWRTDRLSVESDVRLQYHMDGEYREIPAGDRLEIEVHRQRLPMII